MGQHNVQIRSTDGKLFYQGRKRFGSASLIGPLRGAGRERARGVGGVSTHFVSRVCVGECAKVAPTWLWQWACRHGNSASIKMSRSCRVHLAAAIIPGRTGLGLSVFDLRSRRDSTLCACTGNGGYER